MAIATEKISTKDAAGGLPLGIPICVDPQGLQDADKTMASTVIMELEGVPLKITLRRMLMQLGMTDTVRDGLLTLTANNPDDNPSPYDRLFEMDRRGELSKEQYKELMEVSKLRIEFLKLYRDIEKLETEPEKAKGPGFQ